MPYTLFLVLLIMCILLIGTNAYLWMTGEDILSVTHANGKIKRRLECPKSLVQKTEWDNGLIDCRGGECFVEGKPDDCPDWADTLFDITTQSIGKDFFEDVINS